MEDDCDASPQNQCTVCGLRVVYRAKASRFRRGFPICQTALARFSTIRPRRPRPAADEDRRTCQAKACAGSGKTPRVRMGRLGPRTCAASVFLVVVEAEP